MKWILDDMVFNDIACAVPAIDFTGWPGVGLMLADATAQAADQDGYGRRQALRDARCPVTSVRVVEIFSLTVGTDAWNILYDHLRAGTTVTANLAEHRTIAWILTHMDDDLVFVTRDKHAAMLALAELGRERVCHSYEFLEHLHSRRCLTRQQFDGLINSTYKQDKSIPIPWRMSKNDR